MNVSDAIFQLQNILQDCGDLELVGLQDIDGQFAIDRGRIFDAIELPSEQEGEKDELVCAFMEPVCEHTDGPHLSVVKGAG